MSFDRWENRMFEAATPDTCEPPEDCPCGCEGYAEDCTYDPDEDRAEHYADEEPDVTDGDWM